MIIIKPTKFTPCLGVGGRPWRVNRHADPRLWPSCILLICVRNKASPKHIHSPALPSSSFPPSMEPPMGVSMKKNLLTLHQGASRGWGGGGQHAWAILGESPRLIAQHGLWFGF